MSEKETLQAFLSPQRLRELAGPKVYARGEKYAAGDHVQVHEHTRDEAIGEVMGTHPYRVELRLTSEGLTAECTCPAMSDHGFCKTCRCPWPPSDQCAAANGQEGRQSTKSRA